jgi:hypothetical protein
MRCIGCKTGANGGYEPVLFLCFPLVLLSSFGGDGAKVGDVLWLSRAEGLFLFHLQIVSQLVIYGIDLHMFLDKRGGR